MKNPNVWKYIALAALGMYVYQVAQKNGGKLAGNPEGLGAINSDRIVDSILPWLNIHPMAKQVLGMGAKKFINGLNG